MNNEEFWNSFCDIMKSKLNEISYNTWIKDILLVSKTSDTITINARGKYPKEHLKRNYVDIFDEVVYSLTNKNYNFIIIDDDDVKENENVLIENKENDINIMDINSNLNPNYTFENFIVGDTNRLAQAVALSVAEQPGKLYNPLFIYGKSGLGKTHLMHAVGNFVKSTQRKSVLYVTSEKFIEDFTGITRKNDDNYDLIKHFKDKYRNIDVLLIDDIQFLGGASKTQDEFFNTFNFLHGLNKQIIISSDRSPDDLQILEERLRTRFSWGITININPPDYDLRLKILKNKISGHETGKLIKPEVLEFIASNSESDVRHLEGAINRLYAYTAIYMPDSITREFAEEALSDYLSKSIYMTNDISKIQKSVANYFNITIDTLKSKKRTSEIAYARQIAMYLCKMNTDETIERIGLEFNRNHATVIYACDKVAEDYKTSEILQKQIKEIKDSMIT